jgi:phytanoyl-CoA hydroxylase
MIMYMNEKISFKSKYVNDGYAIVRNLIGSKLVNDVQNHVKWLCAKYPNVRPEAFHHDLLVNDPFIHHLLDNSRLLDMVEKIIGPDIALFGAHYIAKKPVDGRPVGWHQDGSYWPLEPMNVVSVWLAGSISNKENGCMRVIPGTQNKKLMKPSEMVKLDTNDFVLDLAISSNDIDDSRAIDIDLNEGDISFHNPSIVHGSNSNKSNSWRIGLTLRFIPTSTFVNRKDWSCILLRGHPVEGVNNTYVEKPVFNYTDHMAFSGMTI